MRGCREHGQFNPDCHWCWLNFNSLRRMTVGERSMYGINDELWSEIKKSMARAVDELARSKPNANRQS